MNSRIAGGLHRLAKRLSRLRPAAGSSARTRLAGRALPYVTRDAMIEELHRRGAISSRLHEALASKDRTRVVDGISTRRLIKELTRRNKLTDAEAETLLDKGSLANLYANAEDEDTPWGERLDGTAYERASAAIRYGDLDEALLQVGRILPGLDRLPDLARSKKEA